MISTTTPDIKTAKLLVVDDDPSIVSQLQLALDHDYQVYTADNPAAALEVARRERPDVVTLDLGLEEDDPETGFGVLEQLLRLDPHVKIVLITGNDGETNALRAVEHGAFDFFGKPFNLEELRILLGRALSLGRLEKLNAKLLKQLGEGRRLGQILGQSPEMNSVFQVIRRVADTNVPVLILGDSGTGKELVAREIRRLGSRATKPFVSISCGAIPENLLESELFGHEKGSFTGAHTSRAGRLELANGGIVFLDEIGELPLQLQVKLLRFLQEYEVERVGGRSVINLDVRIIAATNRDLKAEVKRGNFREDHFYRLSVVNIHIPPLRERREDILYLAQFFLDRFSGELGRGKLTFTRQAKEAIRNYGWPGNVRELEHHVQRSVLMSSGRSVDAADLELTGSDEQRSLSLRNAREATDREIIIQALRRTGGNVSNAAKELKISRPSLHDLLRKLQINAKGFKSRTDLAPEEE